MSTFPDPRHGVPSCSSFERLAACPRSFSLSIGQPDTGSADAESGTRIHHWLETQETPEWDVLSDAEQETAERCYEQREAIVRDWCAAGDGPFTIFHEKRLGMTLLGNVVDVTPESKARFVFTGQADLTLVEDIGRALVVDYKTGRGDAPVAKDNPQLRGLAALVARRHKCTQVTVAIVQPWAGPPSVAMFDFSALEKAVVWSKAVVAQTVESEGLEPVAGEWCHYCPAAKNAVCPAFRAAATSAPDALSVETLPADPDVAKSALVARAVELPADELARLLKGRRLVQWYLNAIEAAARIRLGNGESIPGFALKETRGKRDLSDPQQAFDVLAPLGITAADMLAACTASLPKLETAVRKASGIKPGTEGHKIPKFNLTTKDAKAATEKALGELIVRRPGSLQLVGVDDVLTDGDDEEGEES